MTITKCACVLIAIVGLAGEAMAQQAPPAEEPSEHAEHQDGAVDAPAEEPREDAASPEAAIVHRPLHQLSESDPELLFQVTHPERLGQLIVRWRPMGDDAAEVREQAAERRSNGVVAVLEGARVELPGIVYWVVHRDQAGHERPVFASQDDPHPVSARETRLSHYERVSLARRGGRRSRAIVAGEYVSLGGRAVRTPTGAQTYSEHYYRLEAGFSYAFFRTVDAIRLSLGRIRGNLITPTGPSDQERGMDYGSAEIMWRAHDLFHVGTSVLFAFSQEGFEYGAGIAAVIGELEGTGLTLGVEGVSTLGITGLARLGWLTVPHVPMGATIEVTTFPVGEQAGVRLLYDIGYEIYPGAYVKIEAGYRGWSNIAGGLSLGAEVALSM